MSILTRITRKLVSLAIDLHLGVYRVAIKVNHARYMVAQGNADKARSAQKDTNAIASSLRAEARLLVNEAHKDEKAAAERFFISKSRLADAAKDIGVSVA